MIHEPLQVLDRLSRALAQRAGVFVEVGGDTAYTDGKVVHLPALPETSMSDHEWRITNGLLNHEAGHVCMTAFDAMPPDPLLGHIVNTLEDPRSEHLFCRRYPGAAADLHIAHEAALVELSKRADTLEPYQQRLLALLCRLDGLAVPSYLGADAAGWSVRWGKCRTEVISAKTTHDLLPLAERIHADLLVASPSAPSQADEGVGAPPQLLGTQPQATGGAPLPGYSGMAGATSLPAPVGGIDRESLLSQAMRSQVNGIARRPGYRVVPITRPRLLPNVDGQQVEDLARRTVPALARRLAIAVQAETQSRWLPDQERGRIDPRRLHRLINGTSRRIFRRLERGESIDTAATLITDFSSSMKGSELVTSTAATVVARALERVRVSTEVLAFCGQALYVAKAFSESASVTAGRLASLTGRSGTPLGEVVLAAVKRLIHQPAERHLVFVVTDGQPNNAEYLADILRRCARVRVEVIGVGISTDVSHLFKRSIAIPTVDQLAPALLGQIRSVLMPTHHRRS